MSIKKTITTILMMLIIGAHSSVYANPQACAAIVCLMNVPGMIPTQCQEYRKPYFAIVSTDSATMAAARYVFLLTCPFIGPSPGSDIMSTINAIQQKYGAIYSDPGY